MEIRVCITDDHALFRFLMRDLVKSFDGVDQEVKEAGHGRELLSILDQHPIDVVLLDLLMPVMDGRTAAERIMKKHPDCKIIMLSMNDDPAVVINLLGLGVHGYLAKNCQPQEVEWAIHAVFEKDFYHNAISAAALKFAGHCAAGHPLNIATLLSSREREVLMKICDEYTMKEISDQLSISLKTVENHRMNILKKTGVRNTAGLVKFAFEMGILSTARAGSSLPGIAAG